MIETTLLNYGVLGLWTLALLYDRYAFQKQIKKVIENNTIMLYRVDDKLKSL